MGASVNLHLRDAFTLEAIDYRRDSKPWIQINDGAGSYVTVFPVPGDDGPALLLEALRDLADQLEALLLPETIAAGLAIINEIATEQAVGS